MTDLMQPRRITYLILVQPYIVAMDIAQTITDYAPQAAVIQAQTPTDAARALCDLGSIATAFLGMSPRSFLACGLATLVRGRGGRVVFIGDAAEDVGPGPDWSVLKRPFTTDCVLGELSRSRQPLLLAGPWAKENSIRSRDVRPMAGAQPQMAY